VAHYSIKELEHLSGIKAHTIRIWEQRYGLLSPQRTDTNIRFYTDADLKMLLNVSLLNEKGYKISRIAKMSAQQVAEEILALATAAESDKHLQINALLVAMIELNEEKFDKALTTPMLQLGFEKTMLEIVYPFLNRIGILWQTNNICPAHEHFVSNLIRQKLIVAIDGQVQGSRQADDGFLLFLPEGELHELALLFMSYLLRVRKRHTLYLGQCLPHTDLIAAQKQYQAAYLVTAITSFPERDQVQTYLHTLSRDFPETTILVYGAQVQHGFLEMPANVKRLNLVTDFISAVTQ
jgi:MerR family transcriptional regulator, light-induced transcriptional regulator